MEQNHLNRTEIHTKKIIGGTTMRDICQPENNNMALHVCQNPEMIKINRKALSNETISLNRWVLPWQKHTANIVRVTGADAGKGAFDASDSILSTDGLYTTEPDLLIGVFTADCLGILIADDTTPCVAVVHSGWKGTVQHILYQMMQTLLENDLITPQSVQIFFSPSIQQKSFEIGPEVKEQLLAAGEQIGLDFHPYIISEENGSDRSYADHQGMNIAVLRSFGIPEENIHPSLLDTKTTDTCFSFRRDKDKTGEHFTYGYIHDSTD